MPHHRPVGKVGRTDVGLPSGFPSAVQVATKCKELEPQWENAKVAAKAQTAAACTLMSAKTAEARAIVVTQSAAAKTLVRRLVSIPRPAGYGSAPPGHRCASLRIAAHRCY